MGLAEKRMLARLRDETVPRYESELRQVTGSDIALDIDWDSFASSTEAIGNLEDKALRPLAEIFSKVAIDQIGKDAVKESIQTIRLSHDKSAPSNAADLTLQGGALTVRWDWEGWAGSFFPDSVQEKIESML